MIEEKTEPRPFDFSRAVQRPLTGPHYLYEDPHDNKCLWVIAGRSTYDFLLNVTAYDAFVALPATGIKYVRFKGSRDNVDVMFPIEQLRINQNDTFDGKYGSAYRINLARNRSGAFTAPAEFTPF